MVVAYCPPTGWSDKKSARYRAYWMQLYLVNGEIDMR